MLDRIGQLPTMKVEIDDEGKYGRSLLHGRSVGRKAGLHMARRQVRREGPGGRSGRVERDDRRHVRGTQGRAQGERLALGLESPITAFPDFEQLEFKGQQNHQYLAPFLQAMKQLADQRRADTVQAASEQLLEQRTKMAERTRVYRAGRRRSSSRKSVATSGTTASGRRNSPSGRRPGDGPTTSPDPTGTSTGRLRRDRHAVHSAALVEMKSPAC